MRSGRVVETIQRNGSATTEQLSTRTTYDIRGNTLTISDPLSRLAFRHVYDLANRPLRIESIDAGLRRLVLDVMGNEVERRDGKGEPHRAGIDLLNRPTHLWAKHATAAPVILRERLIYGEQADFGID